MLHPEDRDRVLGQYRDFLENGGPHLTEYRLVRPDGRIVWIRDRAEAVHDAGGRVILERGLMIDVTELKEAEAAVRRHAGLLERADRVSRKLTELVLQGGEPGQILRVLARVVGNPVLFEDAAHQLIDFATCSSPVDDVLVAWDGHSRVGHPDNPNGVVVHDKGNPRCAWIPLSIRGDLWGRLHVLEIDNALDDADKLLLDRGAAAIGLALLSQRDAAHLSDHARSTLIAEIATGKLAATGEILRRARGLGADLEGKTLAALVLELRATGGADPDRSEHDRQRIWQRVLEETRRTLAGEGCSHLPGLEGDRLLVLGGVAGGRPAREVLEQVGAVICRRIVALGEQVSLTVGFSRPSTRPAFGRVLQEALEAAAFGAPSGDRSQVQHFGELGVHHLLARLAEGPELSSFVESELSPLLDHDATAKVPLLPTLAAFLEQGGAKAAAARALHVERRTLYFRIARIEKLLGRSLSDREVQLRCHLAIRGLDLLKHRSPSAGLPRAEGRWDAPQRPAAELAANTGPGGTEPPGESARSHACDDHS
jgi:PucR family transcriptional regulator, purine catabolism regulatory protein